MIRRTTQWEPSAQAEAINRLVEKANANELRPAPASVDPRLVLTLTARITAVTTPAEGTLYDTYFEWEEVTPTRDVTDLYPWDFGRYGDGRNICYPLDRRMIYFIGDIVHLQPVLVSGEAYGWVIVGGGRAIAPAVVLSSAVEAPGWKYLCHWQEKDPTLDNTGYSHWVDQDDYPDFYVWNDCEEGGTATAAVPDDEIVWVRREIAATVAGTPSVIEHRMNRQFCTGAIGTCTDCTSTTSGATVTIGGGTCSGYGLNATGTYTWVGNETDIAGSCGIWEVGVSCDQIYHWQRTDDDDEVWDLFVICYGTHITICLSILTVSAYIFSGTYSANILRCVDGEIELHATVPGDSTAGSQVQACYAVVEINHS